MSEGFTPYKLEEERAKDKTLTFTVWLSEEEKLQLVRAKKIIEQPKNSTALKMLAKIGIITLDDPKIKEIIGVLFKNKLNNKRNGIAEIE